MKYARARTAIAVIATLGLAALIILYFFQFTNAPLETPDEKRVGIMEVHPGEDIQAALDAVGEGGVVRVNAGVYRPKRPGQALIHFNARHDGVVLEGVGEVILTAANPNVAIPHSKGYPAIVNHVVYFGDEVSSKTVLRNFKITGANGFVDGPEGLIDINTPEDLIRTNGFRAYTSPIESNSYLAKSHEFFCDGGGILIFGRSHPTIDNVEIYGNRSSVCGGGVSVLQQMIAKPVRFTNCVFRDNHAAVSGSAIDVFSPGSWVELENCLFVGNVSDEKLDYTKDHGFGALTVFPQCRVTVSNCTFTDNWSAIGDRSTQSVYRQSIFWKNTRTGGMAKKPRFELDLYNPGSVEGCFLSGPLPDLRSHVPRATNHFDPPDPDFDGDFRPRNPVYSSAGFRPVHK